MEEEKRSPKPTVWASDHRIVYAQTFSVKATNSEVFIDLGTEQTLDGQDVVFSNTQLIISHQGAKVLQIVLTTILEKIEEISGTPIMLPPGKAEAIRALGEAAEMK